jgi:hypothetical protein
MHGSRSLVFVADVPKDLCAAIESELLWQGCRGLPYKKHCEAAGIDPASHTFNCPVEITGPRWRGSYGEIFGVGFDQPS